VRELSPQVRVRWVRGEAPVLLVLPGRGQGYTHLAQRFCGDAAKAAELAKANPSLPAPLSGIRVRIPWHLLSPTKQREVFAALFPADRRLPEGWEHQVVSPWGGEPESLWEIAEWFTGSGKRYTELKQANPHLPLFPPLGSRVFIPERLLMPTFRAVRVAPEDKSKQALSKTAPGSTPHPPAATPPPATPGPVPVATPPDSPELVTTQRPHGEPAGAGRGAAFPAPTPTPRPKDLPASTDRLQAPPGVPLEYRDGEAIYRLAPGEALYSAVVVRFTGLLHASDVNATAFKLAELSGIRDVTAIPVGYPIRIPFDLLLPEYLPLGHPRRLAWEKEREELFPIRRVLRAANLEGIHIILDAGHGGADTGAIAGGIWEATYTYDVMTRLKRVLERETKATVWLLVRDLSLGDDPPERDRLPASRRQVLLTTPTYKLEDSTAGVHLRWVLANALMRKLQKRKVDPERVVMVSVHADSLHPAVRGLMVYVPGRRFRPGEIRAPAYLPRVAELALGGQARFHRVFAARSEALSSQLADSLVATARRFDIPVHPFDPVRSHVIRGGRAWVPAVLRFSAVPTAVLVEIVNLNNEEDRKLLLSWKFREKLAHALAAGLAEAFAR